MAEVEAGGDWVQLDLSGSARGGQVIAQQSRGTQEEEDGKEGLDQLQGFRYVVEKYRDVASKRIRRVRIYGRGWNI
jgi:hypothetical protein